MSLGKFAFLAAFSLASTSFLLAADEPTTQPAETGTPKKLFEPYTLLKDLTPEQSAQIEKIHQDYLADRRKLEIKQKDDIAAVLTPAQATELITAEDKLKAEKKAKAAEKKLPTTEPAK